MARTRSLGPWRWRLCRPAALCLVRDDRLGLSHGKPRLDAHPEEAHDASARALFWAKSRLLIARRLAANLFEPRPRLSPPRRDPRRRRPARRGRKPALHARRSARARARAGQGPEPARRRRRHRRHRDRAGETFSYWRAAGRASRAKGYVIGRELRQGCVIPTVGGGICQLTNALSRISRDRASRRPGNRRAPFAQRPSRGLLHRRHHRRHRLLELYRLPLPRRPAGPDRRQAHPRQADRPAGHAVSVRSCATCDETGCAINPRGRVDFAPAERTTFVLDDVWSEYASMVAAALRPEDQILAPGLFGAHPARYDWPGEVEHRASLATLRRHLAMRRVARGAGRGAAAGLFAPRPGRSRTRARQEKSTIARAISSSLWPGCRGSDEAGVLGGRSFDVVMSRYPMAEIHARLDAVAAETGASATIADFRADPGLVARETDLLARARRIVTPAPRPRRALSRAGAAARLAPPGADPADARKPSRLSGPNHHPPAARYRPRPRPRAG